jgi:hypoxanthine phosphoribosyltransferase
VDIVKDLKDRIEVLISQEQIQQKVKELGAQISHDFAGKEMCVIGILKGCFLFMADLIRHIDVPLSCDFLGVSSYGSRTKSSGVVKITSDLTFSVTGKDLLIVEDILDTGLTLSYLMENLRTRKPESVKICTLLHKPSNTVVDIKPDYVGFTVPDRFVIGYGLDFDQYYRNLPFIGTLNNI